jgi:hypothetical protein
MEYLLTSGILSLLLGLLLLFSPALLGRVGEIANRIILYLDEKLQAIRIWAGLFLVVAGGWILYILARYPELSYLNSIWIICLVFGLLFLFMPNWLSWLSKVSNNVIFSTDDVVMGFRKIIGIILIIVGIYIFYGVYLLK